MSDAINIAGHRGRQFATGIQATKSPGLNAGNYDVQSDKDIWIRVAGPKADTALQADKVLPSDGYRIFAGNVVTVAVPQDYFIGAVAASDATVFIHRV